MSCADPGICVSGGGGGPGQSDFAEVKWSISKKSIIFQGSRGGLTFSRGVQQFPGGGGGGGSIAYSL